ncbi:MAG: hypothetical protein KGJ23_07910 [Euryarchaeota archaeon]|nr:hypothetical protein [Euryarchaeota archaeon]MDE1836525.1 hypothetical protein [Euryarchaeota archaeon]MDE1879280.1 hypothetical protein [Euryarchaeota archaeon]MDE2044495.1 hypothetical protein [Thermoplasmata archaeon]
MGDEAGCRHEQVTTDGNNVIRPRNFQGHRIIWCTCVKCGKALKVSIIIDGFASGQDVEE